MKHRHAYGRAPGDLALPPATGRPASVCLMPCNMTRGSQQVSKGRQARGGMATPVPGGPALEVRSRLVFVQAGAGWGLPGGPALDQCTRRPAGTRGAAVGQCGTAYEAVQVSSPGIPLTWPAPLPDQTGACHLWQQATQGVLCFILSSHGLILWQLVHSCMHVSNPVQHPGRSRAVEWSPEANAGAPSLLNFEDTCKNAAEQP